MPTKQSAPTTSSRSLITTLATGVGLVIMIALSLVMDVLSGGGDALGPDATNDEIAAFLGDHHTGLQWDLAGRFLILLVLFLPISIGLSCHVRGDGQRAELLSRMVPYLAVWLMAIGAIANTVQAMLLFEGDRLIEEPAIARMLLLAVTGLFLLAMLPHGAIIGVVSEAGRRTGTLPIWLSGLGYVVSLACAVAVLTMPRSLGFIDSSMPGIAAGIAYTAIGPWYLVTGVVLIVKGRPRKRIEPIAVADDDPAATEPSVDLEQAR